MSRVVFLMDKIMRPLRTFRKSVVPLISGTAIPAIMSARNGRKLEERLITILVTPFTTCSFLLLPVYAILISLIIIQIKVILLFFTSYVMVLYL
jgi:ferrous iron transport protein B